MAWLLFSLAAICLLAGLHPFTAYPASLALLRKFRRKPIARQPGHIEKMALGVCAYNEEAGIAAKAENMLAQRKFLPDLDLHVYVDAASDRTAEILNAYQDRIAVTQSPQRMGKSHGINVLLDRAKAPILVLTDANVQMAEDALARIAEYFADPQVGCVCGHLIYTNGRDSATAASASLYWRLEEWIKQAESDTGSLMGADGAIYAVRRDLIAPIDESVMDDIAVSFQVMGHGKRIIRAPEALAYETTATDAWDEFRRKVRIACGSWRAHRRVWPIIRRQGFLTLYKYASHKLLRWFAFPLLAAAAVLLLGGLWLAGQAVLALGLFGAGLISILLGALGVPGFSAILSIVIALLGAFIGVMRGIAGRSSHIWTPVASTRQARATQE